MTGIGYNEDNALLRILMETRFCPKCMNNFEGEECPYCKWKEADNEKPS